MERRAGVLRVGWSLGLSLAMHTSWVAAALWALAVWSESPHQALVEFEVVEFAEESPSEEGEGGREDWQVSEEVSEGEAFVEGRERLRVTGTAEGLGARVEGAMEASLGMSERLVGESAREVELALEGEGVASARAVEQGTAMAREMARVAKAMMWAELESERAGGSRLGGKLAGERVPTVLERVKSRGEAELLTGLEAGDVVVVRGAYDAVEYVLRMLDVPFRLVSKGELFGGELSVDAVVLLNCDDESLTEVQARRLGEFVEGGGFVFSSDWELHNVLLLAFPSDVGLKMRMGASEVEIAAHPVYRFHPFLRDVFEVGGLDLRGRLRWVVDGASDYPVLRHPDVLPLVVSEELSRVYGGEGAVAFTYSRGLGCVLHVLSHFKSQVRASGDGYALQQMLVNFILVKQRLLRGRGRR